MKRIYFNYYFAIIGLKRMIKVKDEILFGKRKQTKLKAKHLTHLRYIAVWRAAVVSSVVSGLMGPTQTMDGNNKIEIIDEM